MTKDEIEDILFCKQLSDDYDKDTDPEKHSFIYIEDLMKDLGIKL